MCGMNAFRGMAPNAQFNEADIKPKFGLPRIPTGHAFDRFGAALSKDAREKADPKTRAILEGVGKGQAPPKRSSPPSGGPTRLGIRRSTSTRKRGGVSGRSRSRSKAFSTKR
jgi:hypothetical protein